MGLNFFNDKFYRLCLFYRYNFDKLNVSKTNLGIVFGQTINDFEVKQGYFVLRDD
jgi:hypothetical protein